jgi:hypothetical protein
MASLVNSTSEEELTSASLKLLRILEMEGIVPAHFMRATSP